MITKEYITSIPNDDWQHHLENTLCPKLSDKTLRLFAVACARSCLTSDADTRSVNAVNVAERYALGKATADELGAAWSAARSAAYSAAESAAGSAANSAAYAAWSAARSAARSAAVDRQKALLIEVIEKHEKRRGVYLSNQGTEIEV